MIKNKTAEQLRHVALAGGSLHVDAADFTAEQLRHISLALSDGSSLIISNSDRLTAEQMRHIALGSGNGATALFQ